MAYYCPGWDSVAATDILMFTSMAEAIAFNAQRNQVIALGEAANTRADAVNYINQLSQLESVWGFHRLTPTQREIITNPTTTTIPPPTMEQRTIARAYNDAVGNRAGRNNDIRLTATGLPANEPALYAMMLPIMLRYV